MPASSTTVPVNLAERSYDIQIGAGNLSGAGDFLHAIGPATHAVVITDTNVVSPHGQAVASSLREAGIRVSLIEVAAGEASKSVAEVERLWGEMLAEKADRKSVVAAVGGGVIGDLAGFAAATFARGVSFVQIPTTLLADVDSSVGGKVGVNLPGAKNMVGSFWQPQGVLIDIRVLETLPEREYRAGLAEVVKYGVILDAGFFTWLDERRDALNARDTAVLQQVVARCCQLKADVVEQDERETTGLRAVLNYGHTFCHAFEAITGYGRFLHGEAVSVGMICASRLAESLGRITPEMTRQQYDLLRSLSLPVEVPDDLNDDDILAAMQRDKKVEHGRLRFVLPTRMGHVELVGDIAPAAVRAALRA